VTIGTRHLDASVDFYVKVLKFQVQKRYKSGPDVEIAFITDGNYVIEFISGDFIEPFNGKGVSLGFQVDDIDQVFKYLKKHSVEIIDEPHVVQSGVRLMHAVDLNGMTLGFVQFPN
jgi:lactoylglutathione lyase